MAEPELIAHDDLMERDLYVFALDSPEDLPANFPLASRRFACLLAWDARSVEAARVGRLARGLLDLGAVYFCAWGPDCDRVHDIIDEEDVGPNPLPDSDSVMMTTAHSDEPLSEAIWFVLNNSWPDAAYEAECGSTLAIAIAAPRWADEIRAAFRDPRGFSSRVVEGS